ncbi:MAG TPA: hypothetical protein DEP35_09575 [Deltaproteobacteria bacterium]|jgi:hypothetical protein|nr:hypothetical protein [Deltaproteobacteria bacterium]
MEKLEYVLWKGAGTPIERFRSALLEKAAPRIVRSGARGLTVNIADVNAQLGGTVPVRDGTGSVAATVGVWLACVDEREGIERALRESCARLAGYLVTESVPRDYDARTWPDGERTPGVKLVTLFEKPERLTDEEFIERWHGSHTPLSLEIHPMWCYVRNVVARRLTSDGPDWRGIVDEQFRTAEDLTDPTRFYGVSGDWKLNIQRVLDDCRRFLDLERIQTAVMSEYILQSPYAPAMRAS